MVLVPNFKQSNGYFVPLGNVASSILTYTPNTTDNVAGGSFRPGSFTTASWAQNGSAPSRLTSSINVVGAGGLLKDMGKTVVSSNRTFRKVQLVAPMSFSTSGVADAPAPANGTFLVGYVELNTGSAGSSGTLVGTNAFAVGPAPPLAYMPGLLM